MLEYEIGNKKILLERLVERNKELFQNDSQQVLDELEPMIELYEFYDMGIVLIGWDVLQRQRENPAIYPTMNFFQRAMKGDTVISSTMTADSDGTRVNLYCAPVIVDETPIGAIYAAYETEKFDSLFATPFSGNSYTYVTDSSGQVMIAKNGNYGNLLENLAQEGGGNLREQEKNAP